MAEISIGGEKGNYSTKNVLTVGSDASSQQTRPVTVGSTGLTILATTDDSGHWTM